MLKKNLRFGLERAVAAALTVSAGVMGNTASSGTPPRASQRLSLETAIEKHVLTYEFAKKAQAIADDGRRLGFDILPGYPFQVDVEANRKLVSNNKRLLQSVISSKLSVSEYVIGMWTIVANCQLDNSNAAGTSASSVTKRNKRFCAENSSLIGSILR